MNYSLNTFVVMLIAHQPIFDYLLVDFTKQMRTPVGDLKQILPFDLARGIYSLQSLLLLRRSKVVISCVAAHILPECTVSQLQKMIDPRADTRTMMKSLMVTYAKERFSRFTINHLDRVFYENRAAASGSAREFATIIKSSTDLRNLMLGAIGGQRLDRVIDIFDELVDRNRQFHEWNEFLYLASKNGSSHIVEWILSTIARLDNQTLPCLAKSLEAAAGGRHLDVVQLLVETGSVGLEHLGDYSAKRIFGDGRADLIERILDRSARPFSTKGFNLAVDALIDKHRLGMISMMIDRAISTNYRFRVVEYVRWLSMATRYDLPDLRPLVLDKANHADFVFRDRYSEKELMGALNDYQYDFGRLLLTKAAESVPRSKAIVEAAIKTQHLDIVRLALEQADVSAPDLISFVKMSIHRNRPDLVRLFLKRIEVGKEILNEFITMTPSQYTSIIEILLEQSIGGNAEPIEFNDGRFEVDDDWPTQYLAPGGGNAEAADEWVD